ncbi:MAG: heme A synthase [Nitrospinae bacterium]|nr:heme A synthase [Nitrospinota bacterium]MBF0633707.1 heme A synthase [Nitrospinota bacterium]
MLRLFIGLSVFFTYLLMVMGNIVTTTGSGLACPDWPLCYGTVIPPRQLNIWLEWSHRLLGGTTGFLVLASVITAWFTKAPREQRLLTTTALGLLGVGVVFGGVIVLIEAPLLQGALHLLVISFHIMLSTVIFTLMILAFKSTSSAPAKQEESFYPALLAIVFLQVFIGIFVRYGKASLACPDFPLCRGALFPDLVDFKVTIHFLHRLMATLIFLLATGYFVKALMAKKDTFNASVTFGLVLTQATFGVEIVWTGMFLPFIVLHGATGFFTLAWLVYRSSPYLLGLISRPAPAQA